MGKNDLVACIFAQHESPGDTAVIRPSRRPPWLEPVAARHRPRIAQPACPPADWHKNSHARPDGWRRRASPGAPVRAAAALLVDSKYRLSRPASMGYPGLSAP